MIRVWPIRLPTPKYYNSVRSPNQWSVEPRKGHYRHWLRNWRKRKNKKLREKRRQDLAKAQKRHMRALQGTRRGR